MKGVQVGQQVGRHVGTEDIVGSGSHVHRGPKGAQCDQRFGVWIVGRNCSAGSGQRGHVHIQGFMGHVKREFSAP